MFKHELIVLKPFVRCIDVSNDMQDLSQRGMQIIEGNDANVERS